MHVADAVMQGFHKILVRTVDTDVVVLAIAAVHQLLVAKGKNFGLHLGMARVFTNKIIICLLQKFVKVS